jgi:hypothetical protein
MVLFGLVLVTPLSAEAQLTAKAESEIKKTIAGRHFLRIDLPVWYTAGRYAEFTDAVVEVSPSAIDYGRLGKTAPRPDSPASNFRGLGPNEPVQYGTAEFDSGAIVVWFEGTTPKNDLQAKVRFVGVRTLDDFQSAFSRVFSKVAPQDEHPERAEEIRQAIAQRKVINGMTSEQAASAIGRPLAVIPTTESGVAGEGWVPRQENGTMIYPRATSVFTGYPTMLKFVGGILREVVDVAPSK